MKFFYALFLVVFVNNLFALDVNKQFETANILYKQKQYEQAKNIYLSIEKTQSEKVFFNVANSYYQLKQYPNAILYYEKALKINPNDATIQHNLNLSYNKALTKIETKPTFILITFFNNFIKNFNSYYWSIFALILLCIASGSLGIYFLLYNKIYFRNFGFLILCFGLIAFIFSQQQAKFEIEKNYAIVVSDSTFLYNKQLENSKIITNVQAGNKIKILDKDGNWYKIELQNGKNGWLLQNKVKTI